MQKRKVWIISGLIFLSFLASVVYKFWPASKNMQMSQAVPVSIEKARQETVTIDLKAVGKVFPYSTVDVRSQVEGPIVEIHFERGQDVKAGDILFTIDTRPYEIALQLAEANLAKEKALLTDANADMRRAKPLFEKKYISEENYDQVYSGMLTQEAAVRAAEANVTDAKLQLEYCTIRSPIDGRTGDILVHLGNLVKVNDTQPLVIINQLNPIFVSFDVPEKFLPAINKRLASEKIFVTVKGAQNERLSDQGELFFVDNTIDTQTGTIELKANFANELHELWPGQFVNVELGLANIENAIVVPTRAIQRGQQGSYVFVVNAAEKAEFRLIKTAEAVGNDTIISQGLAPDELVVVDGQFRLVDGSVVTVQ